jgi:hypothetical protein
MSRPCFNKLCREIEKAVGSKNFKSELFLQDLKKQLHSTPESSIYHARLNTVGPDISGEWKVAVSLRMLAGASYLDMYLWANINQDYVNMMSRYVFKTWFCHKDVLPISFYDSILKNKRNQAKVRKEFSTKTGGIFSGCIGALDGWLVRICCPTMKEVTNPGKYFSRKGFLH